MPALYRVISNKPRGRVTILVPPSNAVDILPDDLAVDDNEVVTGLVLRRAIWASDAYIQVKRGANVVATYTYSGDIDYAGLSSNVDVAESLNVATLNTNCHLVLELSK